METFSALLALCVGNSPFTGEFPWNRPVTRSFDILFGLCLNKRLSNQSRRRWFETPSRSLWRHCNEQSGVLALPDKTKIVTGHSESAYLPQFLLLILLIIKWYFLALIITIKRLMIQNVFSVFMMISFWYILQGWMPIRSIAFTSWRYQMKTFSTWLALCEGKPPVTGGFSSQRTVTRIFDFHLICA